MPEFQSFLDGQNMATFWGNVKWILFLVAPIVMIWFAVDVVGWLIKAIRGAMGATENKRTDDDDDIYYY